MGLGLGQIVRVRSRQYVVEDVEAAKAGDDTLVRLSCLDDDAQGQRLEVLWEREVDAKVVGASSWESVAKRGFDDPSLFSAYLHTLRWSCVTSTNPKLFQAPYRAGIEVKAYQLEPLRKALLMPRVSLFIADDVGLGKTIEAGLILREMLLRQKVRRVVIACPPSVVRQWKEEMENRFGLGFVIYDRGYVASKREERGYGVNPWTTHTRFIVSHPLLRDEAYAGPLRDWLGVFAGGSLLILDEAHNAAPASGSKYAIDSHFTRAVRDLAPRFEHKLFLSATPHNGHSNSFAALLEILDPQRFCRGVPVKSPKLLDAVMVRRLKADLREVEEGFPERKIIPIVIRGLPETAPELRLSRLLHEYRKLREARLADARRSERNAALLVITSLQKRLLSSIEAFACTLHVHRRALARASSAEAPPVEIREDQLELLAQAPGPDDARADLPEAEVQAEEEAEVENASASGVVPGAAEQTLLEEMTTVANAARYAPDRRFDALLAWMRSHQCPELGRPGAAWLPRRLLIFTEYADTKRWLMQQLEAAIEGSDRAGERVRAFHGGMGDDRRDELKAAFNADPEDHPLRILVATDAAREGVNLQNNCADLFHFDVPWNPSRMEQRNGRIDRKLQRAEVVRCHYFVLPQRVEDRVLEVLVEKTGVIHQELGALSPVIERSLSRLLSGGIAHDDASGLAQAIEAVDKGDAFAAVVTEELEAARQRKSALADQLEQLREMLELSRTNLGLDDRHFRDALSASLGILGTEPLVPLDEEEAAKDPSRARWILPPLDLRRGADPSWAATLDVLRTPRERGQKPWEWRREAQIRPVVFRDPMSLDGKVVHLHLEHRVVQRLLGRFLAQGFVHDELTRACVCLTDDAEPKVLALGRLSLYGHRAARLHDEVIAVAAPWKAPSERGPRKLAPLGEGAKEEILSLVETSLATPRLRDVPEKIRAHLMSGAPRDVAELIPHLEKRAATIAERARKQLVARGEKEAAAMVGILDEQKKRISERIKELETPQLFFDFDADERKQLEADRRYWPKRLKAIDQELVSEPARVRETYEVKAQRVEPVGLVYLWPVSG